MALLDLADRLRRDTGAFVAACHVDHGLRGTASRADAAFVERWCRDRDLPLDVQRVGVRTGARIRRKGLEEAARHLRYVALARSARAFRCPMVLTAHTLGDQAETVLMNLLRGAGPAGLAGMAAEAPWPAGTGPRLGRPLLGVSRTEILAYLKKRRIPWREDATNEEPIFLRNRIRPTLRLWERWRPGFFARVAQTAQILRDEEEYWRKRLAVPGHAHRRKNSPVRLDIPPFLRYPIVEQRRRLRHVFGLAHFESVERVRALAAAPLGGPSRGPLDLPGVRVARVGRFLLFRYRRPGTKNGRRSL